MAASTAQLQVQVESAAELIRNSRYCVALTGAGVSTPSGIPDFRSPGSGIWTKYNPMEVASLSAFRYHPSEFYTWLRPFVSCLIQAEPNPAHTALARLENSKILKSIITQNIDGLHQKAGSRKVIEVHGSYLTLTCLGCYQQVEATDQFLKEFLAGDENPSCPHCGKLLKPDIILYEEQLPARQWKAARVEAMACDLMIILGSSLTVTPTCDLPYTAMAHKARMLILNRMSTHLDQQADISIQGDLETILPLIADKVIHEEE
jgi:NAD-dependent deacetylase